MNRLSMKEKWQQSSWGKISVMKPRGLMAESSAMMKEGEEYGWGVIKREMHAGSNQETQNKQQTEAYRVASPSPKSKQINALYR